MKTDLIQKSSVYSDEHPTIKALKKRIAGLEGEIAAAAKVDAAEPSQPDKSIYALKEQQNSLEQDLELASKKLTAARLGESMERNQQSEHLQVIEQPITPQKPIKPNKLKLFAVSFAVATVVSAGVAILAEVLDKTIRGTGELAGVVDSGLLVAIPYITTAGETARRRRKIVALWTALLVLLSVGLAAALYIGVEVDFSSLFDKSWIYTLTRLTK